MNIIVNGKVHELTSGATITDLLEARGIIGKRIAIEVNEEILPRSEYSQYRLHTNDRVEIVRAIGGG
uniref:Sulfur carrier protein ThiS n=1 Tax=Candidatus Kentrum sp. MB TaxID=2138164 RepID=A0A450XW58_9GAMM|nr:MAG: sulfur carrier protein ThiS [Candidatus Kentron sp. MB]VFK33512.1 MAG: sulfur carrier protein ThiS [Candidatus Kentron sp. MB]VFK76246.1 MAG: sulfur carrier protein ThiS [Candidatus Kentron sp. MB]